MTASCSHTLALCAVCEHLANLDLSACPPHIAEIIESAYQLASDASIGPCVPPSVLHTRREKSVIQVSRLGNIRIPKNISKTKSTQHQIQCPSCKEQFSRWQFERPSGTLYSLCKHCRRRERGWKNYSASENFPELEIRRREANILKYQKEIKFQ